MHAKILVLNPPSPPYFDVCRDWAGGFGIAWSRPKRSDYGQSDHSDLSACLPFISSVLSKKEYDFKILDCQILKLNKQQVLETIKNERPNIIVSLIGLPSMKKDLELLDAVKEKLPDAFIVGVGTTCKAIPKEVLLHGGVDIVLRSGYPYVSGLVDLLESLLNKKSVNGLLGISQIKNGEVVSTLDVPDLDLSKADQPAYDHLNPKDYQVYFTDLEGNKFRYLQILGSKGCNYCCFYCPYPVGYGNKVTFRSPKSIVDEIEFLHSKYGINDFFFRDQSFTTDKKHALEVCKEINLRKLDIGWYTEARVNEVNEEILQAMKRAGCKRISYGVETGDPTLLSKYKVGATHSNIKNAFNLTKKTGILTTANIIVGWPEDNVTTLQNTYNFVLALKPDCVNCNTLVPYPGTELSEIASKNSLTTSQDFNEFTPDNCVMKTHHLSAQQLCEAKKKMVQGFSKYQMKKALLEVVTGKRKHIDLAGAKYVFRKARSK